MTTKIKTETKSILRISVFLNFVILLLLGFMDKTNSQSLYINELLASNATINADIVDFSDYADWIEIYNDGIIAINLNGYYLTDDFDNPTKWRIPSNIMVFPKSFLLIWADGEDAGVNENHERTEAPVGNFRTAYCHTNFKLSRAGEQIALFDRDGNLVDSVSYKLQYRDVSYGRTFDGSLNWGFFGEPTPGTSNITEACANIEFVSPPEFSIQGGIYDGKQKIAMSTNSPSAAIKFTFDGSRPTSASNNYVAPITLVSTMVLRARAFETGKIPSSITTASYIIDENPTLPVVSIGAFPETLWGDRIGIYSNEFKRREIPISFEFFEVNGNKGFQIDGGLRLTGQASFAYPQKSFTIYARDRYGKEEINYQIFNNRDINVFKNIYLRNSGCTDNRHTMFRDALQHSIVINKMDIDCQAYRPAKTYINGVYWGIYNVREKLNKYYIASHHNVDADNIDYLEIDFSPEPVVIEGDADDYHNLINFISNRNMSSTANYNYIKSQIDIDEYLNYLITEMYCDNYNWLHTNVRWWREKTKNSKWRWIMLDLDFGFGNPGWASSYSNDMLHFVTTDAGGSGDWTTLIIRKLFNNSEFKNEFIQRYASYLNTTFHEDRVLHIVDSLKADLFDEMPNHINRWNLGPPLWNDLPIPDLNTWESEVEIMRKFAEMRPLFVRRHIIFHFGLSGASNLSVDVVQPGSGKIFINDVAITDENFQGLYFNEVPIRVKAVPNPGYEFDSWQGLYNGTESEFVSEPLINDTLIKAVFRPTGESVVSSKITENTTLTKSNSPYIALADVVVDSGVTLQIEPGVEIRMPEKGNITIFGGLQMNGTESQPILIKANKTSKVSLWGALCFKNASDSSVISHVNIQGASKGKDLVNQIGAISAFNSNLSLYHVTIDKAPFPVFIQYGNVTVNSCSFYSDLTCDLINIKYAEYAVVENCDFRGNNALDTDAIDYDQIHNGIIRNNKIYNFNGFNSDGIDLGEESKNVLIEGNLVFNCYDKAISVGQASTAIVKNNVIVNCEQGIGIKDEGSYAFVDGNTFYGNGYPIACFEKNIGVGGGQADVKNSIFARSTNASFLEDEFSSVNVTYSISDTDSLTGEGNIYGDPKLGNNFRLKSDSPAINFGDPTSPLDPDGTIADIGAFTYNQAEDVDVLINEIHYNPAEGDDYEFIEITNNGDAPVDLTGYLFTDGIVFSFSAGTNINPGEYIVITKNANTYNDLDCQVFQWSGDPLPNNWTNIKLKDGYGKTIDYVNYDKNTKWAPKSNGGGPSLELRNPYSENLYLKNWKTSYNDGGTPGKPNIYPENIELFINEFMAINDSTLADDFGDYDDWIEIYNKSDREIDIGGLFITDNLSAPMKSQIPITNPELTTIKPGNFLILWADNETSQGVLHLGIKLSGNGEEIGIAQASGNSAVFIDSLNFPEQLADVSYGRYPDGGDIWRQFDPASPVASNLISDVVSDATVPKTTNLEQNYPNPFNSSTRIKFTLNKMENIKIAVYNMKGRLVKMLISERLSPGSHQVYWNGDNDSGSKISSGLYFIKMKTDNIVLTKKTLLLK